MSDPAPFTGFPQQGLSFLSQLGDENDPKDKAWFTEHRSTYDQFVVAPAKAFVEAMGESLGAAISPEIVAQPKTNGSIAPINNDLRFSPDATPYKDHLMFRFWEGENKKTAPTLMLRVSPTDGVGFATSMALADLDRWRESVAADGTGAALAEAIEQLQKATKADVVGEALKNAPKPYDNDHPRAALLRHKGFQVRWIKKTPVSVIKPSFVTWCTKELARSKPVHQWLLANLT